MNLKERLQADLIHAMKTHDDTKKWVVKNESKQPSNWQKSPRAMNLTRTKSWQLFKRNQNPSGSQV